jgi:arginine N-succinyltransferase
VTDTGLENGEMVLLAAGRLSGFRCCFGLRQQVGDGVAIDSRSAELLRVGTGDEVWSVGR